MYLNFKYILVLFILFLEDEWDLDIGFIIEVVVRYIGDLSGYEVYFCGFFGMIDVCIKVLREKGMFEEYIYFDKF